jgi:hypothetical protein
MTPTLVEVPPAGDGWITEVKWMAINGHDWTPKYWRITLAAEALLGC